MRNLFGSFMLMALAMGSGMERRAVEVPQEPPEFRRPRLAPPPRKKVTGNLRRHLKRARKAIAEIPGHRISRRWVRVTKGSRKGTFEEKYFAKKKGRK